jgi:hypothetical protein
MQIQTPHRYQIKALSDGAVVYQHVQAIIVSIDQYAESALGNREYFLNKPHSIGGSRGPNEK